MSHPVDKFLLISVDCLRYDSVSRVNPRLNTPKFDLLTRDYAFAERFFVTAPATRPSHTSMFTGLYPFEHGLCGQTYLKMFAGIPNLFQLFSDAGYEIHGRSERTDVFRFLDYERYIGPMDPNATDQHLGSLEDLLHSAFEGEDRPRFCFLHFWYTHGGYGARGIPGTPNLKALIDAGRVQEALRFYYAAATHVQEFLLVEILKRVNLDEWAVFILGDHGEGFCKEGLAHGDLLHENVIHVPLLVSLPGHDGLKLPRGPLATIDLFPTIVNLAGLSVDYKGYGRDLRDNGGSYRDRWVYSELDNLYGVGFLNAGNLQADRNRVTSRVAMDGVELKRDEDGLRMWSVTDGRVFYRERLDAGDYVLRDVFSGAEMQCEDPGPYRHARNEITSGSNYKHLQAQETTQAEADILAARLRNLGYIE
ncbi:MAG: sulfatase-like hydrolase/transferase [Gemmatimonadota bacterium]|nr:sulfatase-like hydrolase/transferase [Gemmatimonadota bacterium]